MTTFYNVKDEQNRFIRLKPDLKGDGQYDSHTFSYLCVRRIEQEMYGGKPIGLEQKVNDETKN